MAAVIVLDALLNESGIRDEMIDSPRTFAIPPPQTCAHNRHRETLQRIERVVALRIPEVAHGRMAVANVRRSAGTDALGDRMTRRNHQIKSTQIPCRDGRWKQW